MILSPSISGVIFASLKPAFVLHLFKNLVHLDRCLMLELISKHAQIMHFNHAHVSIRLRKSEEKVALLIDSELNNLFVLVSELQEGGNRTQDQALLLMLDFLQSLLSPCG